MTTIYEGRYRIEPKMVEHGCCWETAIVRNLAPDSEFRGMYRKGVALICECDEELAETICEALNSTLLVNK